MINNKTKIKQFVLCNNSHCLHSDMSKIIATELSTQVDTSHTLKKILSTLNWQAGNIYSRIFTFLSSDNTSHQE